MLVLAMLLVACAGARARTFNITYFSVPHFVAPDQQVKIECQYDANFTLLSWFKDLNEFFRYRPGAAPSIRSFPVNGVGTVEVLLCGPVACTLKLGGLTKEATGVYRCDIERDVPPYMYETKTGYMEVVDYQQKLLFEGLSKEYKEGDMIQARCRGSLDSEVRWYINDAELKEFRGSTNLEIKSSRILYTGVPLTMLVKCAEFRHGKEYTSIEQRAKWSCGLETRKNKEDVVENGSIAITGRLGLLSLLCLLDKVFYF